MRRTIVGSAAGAAVCFAVAAAWSFAAVPAAQAETTCDGLPVTISGTEAGEIITGTEGDDVIAGLGGNDTIIGLTGNDRICAGTGDDVVYGEFVAISDEPVGVTVGPAPLEDLSDRIFGEAGDDLLVGNSGTGIINFSASYVADNDHIDGGPGSDIISGGFLELTTKAVSGGVVGLNDTLIGGDDPDTIYGFARVITAAPDSGTSAVVLVGNLNDTIDGGGGGDTIFGDAQTANLGLTPPAAVETSNDTITGGDGDDTVYGDYENVNSPLGGKVVTLGHRDTIDGGPGDDTIFGDAKNGNANFLPTVLGNIDRIDGGAGTDSADGGPSIDTCVNAEHEVRCEL